MFSLRPARVLLACCGSALALSACTATTSGAPGAGEPACAHPGYSAAAASATVRCYLHAVGRKDTETACALLSARARQDVIDSARRDGFEPVYRPTTTAAGCARVAPLMRHSLDQLPSAELARLRTALDAARVGPGRLRGARALVRLTTTSEGRSATEDVSLVRAYGSWKLDSGHAFQIND